MRKFILSVVCMVLFAASFAFAETKTYTIEYNMNRTGSMATLANNRTVAFPINPDAGDVVYLGLRKTQNASVGLVMQISLLPFNMTATQVRASSKWYNHTIMHSSASAATLFTPTIVAPVWVRFEAYNMTVYSNAHKTINGTIRYTRNLQ